MYCPELFKENRLSVLHDLIRTHPLGIWTCWAEGKLTVNHIPFMVDDSTGDGILNAHVAKGNPVWKLVAEGAPSVVVFRGPHQYISPSWYPAKLEHGKVVPTWNYAVVHVHGEPRVVHDKNWLNEHLNLLTNAQEAKHTQPWQVSDAPDDFVEKMINGIVGIQIPIASIQGKWKVSQNRNTADKKGVVVGLGESSEPNAREMAMLVDQH